MRFALALLIASIVALGPAAAQQGNCGPTAELVKALFDKYGEVALGRGTSQTGAHVFELFVNPQTRSWTIVFHQAQGGFTCLMADGVDFEPSAEDDPQPKGSSL